MMNAGPLFSDTWPFNGLAPRSYNLLAIDPPWSFSTYSAKGGNKNAERHYKTLSLEQIAAFPVIDLAMPDALMLCWGTAPMLPAQIKIMEGWGFEYRSQAIWRKTTRNGRVAFSTGYIVRGSHEIVLIGARGNPKTARNVRSIFDGLVREHSRKPEQFYQWAERLMPKARRVELFSRTNRPGWDAWGDEVGKFSENETKIVSQNHDLKSAASGFLVKSDITDSHGLLI